MFSFAFFGAKTAHPHPHPRTRRDDDEDHEQQRRKGSQAKKKHGTTPTLTTKRQTMTTTTGTGQPVQPSTHRRCERLLAGWRGVQGWTTTKLGWDGDRARPQDDQGTRDSDNGRQRGATPNRWRVEMETGTTIGMGLTQPGQCTTRMVGPCLPPLHFTQGQI